MFKEKAMELADVLESGKFHQGQCDLKSFDFEKKIKFSYCCLGVACEISKSGLKWEVDDDPRCSMKFYTMNGYSESLPDEIKEEFDFFSRWGARRDGKSIVINGSSYSTLAKANDGKASFKDIAAYIRKNYQYL